jgi:ribosome-associated protein
MPNFPNVETSLTSTLPTAVKVSSDRDSTLQLAQIIARAGDERKGEDIIVLNVGEVSPLADYFVIITGFSKVQVRAIARSIEEKVEQELNLLPRRTEGQAEGTWLLQDYGDVIVHILMPREREFYNLEAFWGHAKRVEILRDKE